MVNSAKYSDILLKLATLLYALKGTNYSAIIDSFRILLTYKGPILGQNRTLLCPQDLREDHAKLDDIVESCNPGYPFTSDEARLECLFRLYEKMTVSTSLLTAEKK